MARNRRRGAERFPVLGLGREELGEALLAVGVGIGFEMAMDVRGGFGVAGDVAHAGPLGRDVLLAPRAAFEIEGALVDRLGDVPVGVLDQVGNQQLQGVSVVVFQGVVHVLLSHLRAV